MRPSGRNSPFAGRVWAIREAAERGDWERPLPCHLIPTAPSVGTHSISKQGSSTNPNQSRSPGGGGIHTRRVPLSFLILTVMEIGTLSSFRATAPINLEAFFLARLFKRRMCCSAPPALGDDVLPAATTDVLATGSSKLFLPSVPGSTPPSPIPSSPAIISAYTDRFRYVVRVISAVPPKSTSSSAAEQAPRFASEPPSHGAADLPGFAVGGNLAAKTCGVFFPRETLETEIGPTNFGRSGIPEHKLASCYCKAKVSVLSYGKQSWG
jgi:hypothetical protein